MMAKLPCGHDERFHLMGAQNGCCACQAELLAKEVEALQAVVDKLPTTADGVPVVPGMTVFVRAGIVSGREPLECKPVLCGGLEGVIPSPNLLGIVEEYYWTFEVSDTYSTRAAAEAAKEEKDA